MSATTWQENLLADSYHDELNANTEAVNYMIQHGESPVQHFQTLNDTKTVGFMSKITTDNETQVTFHHTIRGSQLTKNFDYYCLMGGSLRAHAVKDDPSTLFF